jgi:hypothetical protein
LSNGRRPTSRCSARALALLASRPLSAALHVMSDESVVGRDYQDLYWLENYLFSKVSARFAQTRTLSAFDFFCIVIWKANRAKSKVARRLLDAGFVDLPSAVSELACDVDKFPEPKERLRVLIQKWRFRLPIPSAILTVLYPDQFTVYDVRVCETLGDFASLSRRVNFEALWEGYTQFVDRVHASGPAGLSLRDKDRWLWGKSVAEQLTRDIETRFAKARVDGEDDA